MEFLDSYRGSLALVVLIDHCSINDNNELVYMAHFYAQSYSITGFFMLSAFLLTYRLLKDFSAINNRTPLPRNIGLTVLKYFIRRFFRIYLIFVCFYAWASSIWPKHIALYEINPNATFLDVALLDYAGVNHLWTIPSEIKYYAVIPVFCLIAFLLNCYSIVFLLSCLAWTIWDFNFNFFDTQTMDFFDANMSLLKPHFPVFLIGSETALAYYLIENNSFLMALINLKWIQFILNYLSLLIAILGVKNNFMLHYNDFAFKTRAALYWSPVLLLSMLNQTGIIATFFTERYYLKKLGKYSFSFYLIHYLVCSTFKKLLDTDFNTFICVPSLIVSYFLGFLGFYLIENNAIKLANFLCAKLDNLTTIKYYHSERSTI